MNVIRNKNMIVESMLQQPSIILFGNRNKKYEPIRSNIHNERDDINFCSKINKNKYQLDLNKKKIINMSENKGKHIDFYC